MSENKEKTHKNRFNYNIRQNKQQNLEIEKDNTFVAAKLLLEDLSKKYSISSSQISQLLEINLEIKEDNKSSLIESKDAARKKEIGKIESTNVWGAKIPIALFENNCGCLEIIAKYSKDILGITFTQLSKALNRDTRTIFASYTNCSKKIKDFDLKSVEKSGEFIPLIEFSNRSFSTFESLVIYLNKKYSLQEISLILKKDYNTVWAAMSRAGKKMQAQNQASKEEQTQ